MALNLELRGKNLTKQQFAELKRDIDSTNKAIKNSAAATKNLTNETRQAQKATKDWAESMQENNAAMTQSGIAMAAAGAAIAAGLGLAVKTAADFQQEMANTQSVIGGTAEDLAILTAEARGMGKTTVFAAREAASAMYSLASAGLDTNQIVDALSGTLSLAAATQSDLAFATRVTVSNIAAFGLAAADADRVANVFAATISGSQATMERLATSLAFVAPVARGVGLSIEQTSAALGVLFNNGINASTAGTALRAALARLLKPSDEAAQVMKDLGVRVKNVSGDMRPFIKIIRDLEQASISTTDAITLFGLRAGPGMMTLINAGADAVEELTKKITGTNKAAEMAAMQINTLEGRIRLLKSALQEGQILIGDIFIPILMEYTDILTGIINKTSEWAKKHETLTKVLVHSTGVMSGLMLGGGALFLLIVGYGSLIRNLPLAIAGLAKFAGLLKVVALSTAGAAIIGIAAGIAGTVIAFKALTSVIDKEKKALQSLAAATKIQSEDMEKIRVGIADWERQLEKLNTLHNNGTKILDRYNKATGEWIELSIGEEIDNVKEKISGLNEQLQIAGGNIYGVVLEMEKVVKLAGVWETVFKPFEAFGEVVDWLRRSLISLSGLDVDFLEPPDTTLATQRFKNLIGLAEAYKTAVERAIDVTPRTQGGASYKTKDPNITAPGGGAWITGPDTEDIAKTLKDSERLEKERIGAVKRAAEEAKKAFAKSNQDETAYVEARLQREADAEERINDIKQAALAEREQIQADYDNLIAESKAKEIAAADKVAQEEIALLATLTQQQKDYYDLITGFQNDYTDMVVKELEEVIEAWAVAGEAITTGFLAAVVSMQDGVNWFEEFEDIISGIKANFEDFIYNAISNIDDLGSAWSTFVNEMKSIFIRAVADIAAQAVMGKLGELVLGLASSGGDSMSVGGVVGGAVQLVAGIATGNPVLAASGAATTLGSFDVPAHDAMAKQLGINVGLKAASFDDPFNDIRARRIGALNATRDLGRRSASDMLNHFNAGFEQSANGLGRGGGDANMTELLRDIKDGMASPPQFDLIIDGKPIHAAVMRRDAKVKSRGSGF